MKNAAKKSSVMDTSQNQDNTKPVKDRPRKKSTLAPSFLTFIIMACFWLMFSGRFDIFHLLLGLVSCLIVSAISSRLLFPKGLPSGLFKCWFKFAGYLPWLFNQIFIANLHVLYLTFHPRMMDLINPKIIQFDSRLKSDVSRATFANSITLTPGTITVHADIMGRFAVHCIDDKSGQSLPGDMEKKVAKVFDE